MDRHSRSRWRRRSPTERLESRHMLTEFIISSPVEVIETLPLDEFVEFVTADLDRDGQLDLIVTESTSDILQIAFGTKDGFGTSLEVPLLYGVRSLSVADVDNDGWQDLLLGWQQSVNRTVLSWARNLGNARDGWLGLDLAGELSTHRLQVRTTAADFNLDGHLDLATADALGLAVRLGTGDGAFAEPISYEAESGVHSVTAADFDVDGDLDLAVLNANSAKISLLINSGDGTFEANDRRYSLGSEGNSDGATPWPITSGDIDGDGDLDLIVGQNYSQGVNVAILLGRGDGSFSRDPVRDMVPGTPTSIIVGDIDADGDHDLVVSNSRAFHQPYSPGVSVLLGQGTPFFSKPLTLVGMPTPGKMQIVDLDGDQQLDMVTRLPSGAVGYFLTSEDETFKNSGELLGTGSGPASVVVGDINSDASADILVANQESNDISVLLGSGLGDGSFSTDRFASGGSWPGDIELADLNHDSHLDVVVLNRESNRVSVLLGRGDGDFESPSKYSVGDSSSMALVDLNDDSYLDVITTSNFPDISILLGNGDGTFRSRFRHRVPNTAHSVVSDDLNGDGSPDVILSNGDHLLIREGNGDRTLGGSTEIWVEGGMAAVTGDFNQDGDVDLAAVGTDSQSLEVLLGDGDLGFESVDRHTLIGQPTDVIAADVNLDGIPDLVTGSTAVQTASFTVMYGRGDGTFKAGPNYILDGTGVSSLAVSDLDHDTDPDLVVVTPEGVLIFLNQTRQPSDRLAGDVNDDGLFNSSDLVAVFMAGEYEDALPRNSTFVEGDWNDDGEFNSSDLVLAFRLGHYSPAIRPVDVSVLAIDSLFGDAEAAEREPIKKAAVDPEPIAEQRLR